MRSSVIKLLNISTLLLIVGLCAYSVNITVAGDLPAPSERGCDPMTKPRPECLSLPSATPTLPAQPDQPVRQFTPEEIEKDKQEMQKLKEKAATIPKVHRSPEEEARELQWAKENSWITLRNNGQKVLATADGAKGDIFLDDEKYPVSSLVLTCEPQGAAYLHSFLATGQTNLYPITVVSVEPGKCILRNKDFSVTIMVEEVPDGQ